MPTFYGSGVGGNYPGNMVIKSVATINSSNIAANTSNVTIKVYGYYSGSSTAPNPTEGWSYIKIYNNASGTTLVDTGKYINPNFVGTSESNPLYLFEWTGNLPHNSSGDLEILFKVYQNCPGVSTLDYLYGSHVWALTPIPRTSTPTLSVSTVNLETSVTISTNRASTDFTHTLKYAIGTLSGTIATGVATSQAWAPPAELADAIPNSKTGTVNITCETYNGAQLVGSKTISLIVTIPNTSTYWPTATLSSIVEGATGLSGFTVFIQGKSKFKVTSTSTLKFGATVADYAVEIDGNVYHGSLVTSSTINKSGTVTIKLTVTDSRGYTATTSTTKTVEAYSAPKIMTFDALRAPNEQGTNLSVPINFSISPLGNQNGKSHSLQYRLTGSSLSPLTTVAASYAVNQTFTYNGILNGNNSYEVVLTVTDSFSSVSQTIQIGTAFALWDMRATGRGFAIGKVSEKDEFEVAIPTEFTNTVEVQGSSLDLTGGSDLNLGSGSDLNLASGASLKFNGVERPHDFLIASATDLNSLTETGTYYCPSNITVGTLVNCPQIYAFALIVNKHAGCSQIMIPYGTVQHDVWHRNYYNGTWGTWVQVLPASAGSASSILTALKTVDGAGSGLDADLLDGYTSASFFRIIESGGDAKNGYEKYSNGMARAWKTYTGTVLASALSATGPTGTYKSAWLAFNSWPITFTSAPRTQTAMTVPAGSWAWLGGVKPSTTTTPGEFFMYKFGSTDTNLEVYAEAHGPI